ncbi:Protein saf4 [Teratosphaeriaceae sp. CCFEE 6253]|nr:Protein saf4 [Teratosphaeriaceae sp. CCFEE 6253]
MGRYVPPDQQGNTSGNKIHKRRAPGTLKKDGTQTVRFEMPYAVICHGCKPFQVIGQGVRFNAVKTKVGNYFSTPIWSFAIKHTACGGAIEIRTDPKNTAYVVVSGGKARDYGDPADRLREGEGGLPILTAEERERRREDAFAQLEGKVEEKTATQDNSKRIEELYRSSERDWGDPWTANKKMRTSFRRERKVLKRDEDATEALKARLGTAIDLLPATKEDAKRARLVAFGGADDDPALEYAGPKAMLPARTSTRTSAGVSRAVKEDRRDALRRQLVGNTRAALDPFGRA